MYIRTPGSWALACLLVATTTSCSTDIVDGERSQSSLTPTSSETILAEDDLLQRIGRGLAVALNDGTVRTWVKSNIDASPYVEWRIPLRDVLLQQPDRREIRNILKNAGLQPSDLHRLRSVPNLELYLPIPAHREAWSGEAGIQVAVRVASAEGYWLYSTSGDQQLVSSSFVPRLPTLVLARSEIEYTDAESAVRGGRRTGDFLRSSRSAPLSQPMPLSAAAIDVSQKTRVYYFYLYRQHDGGLAGSDEVEFFGYMAFTNSHHDCKRYTGIQPKTSYNLQYIYTVAPDSVAVVGAVPTGGEMADIRAWEDDSGACVRTSSDDFYGGRTYYRSDYNRVYRTMKSSSILGDIDIGITEFVPGTNDP